MIINVTVKDVFDSISVEEMVDMQNRIGHRIEIYQRIIGAYDPNGYLKRDYVKRVQKETILSPKTIENAFDYWEIVKPRNPLR